MGHKAVITGASGGLGRAFAWECGSRGWELILTDRGDEALRMLAAGVSRAHGVRVRTISCDLAIDSDRDALSIELAREADSIRMLINVAGFDSEGPFVDRDSGVLVRMMRVNMEAGLVLTHALTRGVTRTAPLRVINTASLAAFYPMPFKATYAATKRFVLSSSLALREELKGEATVTVLCPAGMPTTPDAREAIRAQGIMGQITTVNTSEAVQQSVAAALRGKPVVIPGFINKLLLTVSAFLPQRVLAGMIARRWGAAREHRGPEIGVQTHSRRAS